MKTQLCIIRHGETDWNLEQRIQGQIDIPLNEEGRAQAMAMAFDAASHHAPFSTIYSSDLSRAHETAKALALRSGLEVKTRVDLRERHYGIFQNVVKNEAELQYPDAHALYISRDLDYDFETGESLLNFSKRTLDAFEWIVRHHIGQTVAIICHAGLLDIVYRNATGRALHTPRDFAIPNCALNWFHYNDKGWHVDAWDDHHYLSKVLMDSAE